MRIISGRLRGKKILAPEGGVTRPAPDRFREMLFQLLENRLGRPLGAPNVLDLFAGSGSFGLEAVSRGAEDAVFIDHDGEAIRALQANTRAFRERLGSRVRLEVRAESVAEGLVRLKAQGRVFTLVLAGPPYPGGHVPEILEGVPPLLEPGGVLAIQHHRDEAAPETAGVLRRFDQRRSAMHRLSFYESNQGPHA